ncbi:VOC family protein [Arthrobacter rhombi]
MAGMSPQALPLAFVGLDWDALEPRQLARFWSTLLGRPLGDAGEIPDGGSGFRIAFVPASEPKSGQNRIHLDLASSSRDAHQKLLDRAIALGARQVDIGQRPDEPHVVFADPEGNEFCIIEPGNQFLAGTDLVGAVNCDGTQALGYFWHSALGWPLVWDQDQETVIQAPSGGSKVTWSGPPLMPRHGRDRLRFVVSPTTNDVPTEVRRLTSLGASRIDVGDDGCAVLADPDGNEFTVLPTGLR